ncbi:membrane protein S33 [Saimiriine betaherpesvirus 4]|uniref:Membrane protein S33 n=1 Tax=Saimiriine betaherpesvirus 4 TaxID=1535247 RepID=G8XT59_9BETA|nr:membrane protein S33 [Saimiriine betaherpesvirus 4]AEV81008.1 membrane protein S33 [Saimiriine betaherpesvirus 4]
MKWAIVIIHILFGALCCRGVVPGYFFHEWMLEFFSPDQITSTEKTQSSESPGSKPHAETKSGPKIPTPEEFKKFCDSGKHNLTDWLTSPLRKLLLTRYATNIHFEVDEYCKHPCVGGDDGCYIQKVEGECKLKDGDFSVTVVYTGNFYLNLTITYFVMQDYVGNAKDLQDSAFLERLTDNKYMLTYESPVRIVHVKEIHLEVCPCEVCRRQYFTCIVSTKVTISPFEYYGLGDVIHLWLESRYWEFAWVYILIMIRLSLCCMFLGDIFGILDRMQGWSPLKIVLYIWGQLVFWVILLYLVSGELDALWYYMLPKGQW